MINSQKRAQQLVLIFLTLFFTSQIIQNIFQKYPIKEYDVFYRYILNPFNIAPKNWGMFTHSFINAYERRVTIYTNDKQRITQHAKGLNFPWRRSPWNDLVDQIIANQSKYQPGTLQKRYAYKLCKDGIDGHPVGMVMFDERRIPITSIIRGEANLLTFPFEKVSDVSCQDLGFDIDRGEK